MSILVDEKTRLLVQGITGREGAFHTKRMLDYGTKVVSGVTPGKGGEFVHGLPVYNTVKEATYITAANASIIYVPSRFAVDAIYEAVDGGIKLIICITEGIPTLEMIKVCHYLQEKGARLIGPNSPGVISPGKCKVGIMPEQIHKPGNIGVVSRSGTLTYEVVNQLTLNGLGQSTCIGIGGDPVIGTNFIEILELFERDEETKGIVLIGEIGGRDEEEAAKFIAAKMRKPVVAFIAGRTAPPEKRMGHAGAIVAGGRGTALEKMEAFRNLGIKVAESPTEIVSLLSSLLS